MYTKFLFQDIKRSFINMGFVTGICGLGALLAYNFVRESMTPEGFYYAIVNILAASGFTVFLPVFPVLGYASNFCEEYESGYYRLILSRVKPLKYAQVRMISVALSGGAIVAIPYLLIFLAALSLGIPEVAEDSLTLRVDTTIKMVVIAKTYGVGVMVAVKVLLGFLFGAAWALAGLAFAVWMRNKYVSLIAPFVMYQSMWIFLPDILDPSQLIRGDDVGHLPSVVMECVWLFAAAAVSMAGFKRRCQDG